MSQIYTVVDLVELLTEHALVEVADSTVTEI